MSIGRHPSIRLATSPARSIDDVDWCELKASQTTVFSERNSWGVAQNRGSINPLESNIDLRDLCTANGGNRA